MWVSWTLGRECGVMVQEIQAQVLELPWRGEGVTFGWGYGCFFLKNPFIMPSGQFSFICREFHSIQTYMYTVRCHLTESKKVSPVSGTSCIKFVALVRRKLPLKFKFFKLKRSCSVFRLSFGVVFCCAVIFFYAKA